MDLYLAGGEGEKKRAFELFDFTKEKLYILGSFANLTKIIKENIHHFNFLLDSGAFTFMQKAKNGIIWDDYIKRYADFINEKNIDLFFELDIDNIVGIKEVERLRDKLENLTNKKSIPVFHKSRGLEYWHKIIKNYNYVAIGGIVTREIKPKEYNFFTYFLKTAKENNCKVHGLGFTNLQGLKKYPFYSVDSTSWVSGNKFGAVYTFNGETMIKTDKKQGQRVKNKETAINNFTEWVKFQKYAKDYL